MPRSASILVHKERKRSAPKQADGDRGAYDEQKACQRERRVGKECAKRSNLLKRESETATRLKARNQRQKGGMVRIRPYVDLVDDGLDHVVLGLQRRHRQRVVRVLPVVVLRCRDLTAPFPTFENARRGHYGRRYIKFKLVPATLLLVAAEGKRWVYDPVNVGGGGRDGHLGSSKGLAVEVGDLRVVGGLRKLLTQYLAQ